MRHSVLTPVLRAIEVTLHLVVAISTIAIVLVAFVESADDRVLVLAAGIAFLAVYLLGAVAVRSHSAVVTMLWLTALIALWIALMWWAPTSMYLMIPLVFVCVHLLDRAAALLGVLVVVASAAIVGGVQSGWSPAGFWQLSLTALLAVLISLGYEALIRESQAREELLAELLATQQQLGASERMVGALDERARIARDIHDTIAQGLSSIQMLLYAAEHSADEQLAQEYVQSARQTAIDNLGEARRVIHELAPAAVEERGLADALRRLAESELGRHGIRAEVHDTVDPASASVDAPNMTEQTALYRVAQGALANVRQHSGATQASIELTVGANETRLTVADNGDGFDAGDGARRPGGNDSFGLTAIHERIEQLGGSVEIVSSPGTGARLTVTLPRGAVPAPNGKTAGAR